MDGWLDVQPRLPLTLARSSLGSLSVRDRTLLTALKARQDGSKGRPMCYGCSASRKLKRAFSLVWDP